MPVLDQSLDVETARADLNRWLSQKEADPARGADPLYPNWVPTEPDKP